MHPVRPDYSDAAKAWLARPQKLLIGDRWLEGSSARRIDVENPGREERIAEIAAASIEDLDRAVAAARCAFETTWGRMHGRERARVLLRMAELLDRDADLIGEIMTIDNGTPLASSTPVVRLLGAELFRYYAGWATKISGEAFTPAVGSRVDHDFVVATLREPIGVVGAIVPWNAPAGMMAMKVAPALAAGCAIVLKTAELAPLVGRFFGELMLEAGAPPGTFNLLHGHGDDVGAAMASHPGIDKIAFTGSTRVGRSIAQAAAASNLKRVTLELGGKSPVIVFPDADLAEAIPAVAMACFFVSGQACMAGTRLFVHDDVYDEVAAGVAEVARNLSLGDGLAPGSVIGPVISARQKARIEDYVRIGLEEDGATMLVGGEAAPSPGHFIRPVLFTEVRADMRIAQEEIFGPVLSMIRFRDEADLLREVNSTVYGLSGSVWTRDIRRALRVAHGVDSGQVAVNYHAAMSPETPFGGNRQSGWGRELGREGLEPYLKTKAISINVGPRA
ncbi:aldehyde dehydrogenase family protein [Phenylobacterium sp.]|uniref:aldehyde dehydrogenase family protein n=1 Tax=Phenylobacterium sp. TaxID=1871053 RepID=UPI0025E89297|nr:aldehyde dehydrogenase family protein [Phenylobacterium sp.]